MNKALHIVTFILLVVGGLNWLLQGALGWDIGYFLGGMEMPLARIIYALVGLSAIYQAATHKSYCRECESMSAARPAAMVK